METISNLDGCMKIFQVLGLQCFSLKHLRDKRVAKLIYYRIYIICIALVLTATFWGYLEFTKSQQVQFEALAENSMIVVTKILQSAIQWAAGYSCLILSFLRGHKMLEFFSNSEKISMLCHREFNYNICYGDMKKHLRRMITGLTLIFLSYLSLQLALNYQKPNVELLVDYVLLKLPFIFIRIVYVRFYFYVYIVNAHLKVLQTLIAQIVSNASISERSNVIQVRLQINTRKKFLTCGKIYILIEEMASCINDQFGVPMVLLILLPIFVFIRLGYHLFMILAKLAPGDISELEKQFWKVRWLFFNCI